ncbi:hypothetical protein AKJ64_04750 [candidate division MSBL1 archaeon SCGC-AAA259E17]|uniref:Uncharacterized protein n=1 Tax=candidate division MSBL1 archaeon SCGC-AAA259E17 TaxID=1698263 RepID=A0A133UB43_9EURY|nr:hypothetical protein AKJ64_04750 [candidate division MSBL1 archaeon SCGC-AAA259E17]
MFRDPFDEFRRLEMLIQKLLESGVPGEVSKRGVSIRRSGDKTRIDVRGDVPNSTIRKLEQEYPNAEISVESRRKKPPKPSDTAVKEVEETETEERSGETNRGKLALERFREKEEKEQREDSPAKGVENE